MKIGLSEPARADSGNLEVDLPKLLVATTQAAQAADTSVAVLIDEVQYLTEDELRGVIVACSNSPPSLAIRRRMPNACSISRQWLHSHLEPLPRHDGLHSADV